MKIEYRFANLDDIDQLVRLRTLMQFEDHSDDKTVPDAFTQKVKNYFLKSIPQNKYYSSVAVFENRIVANAGVIFYEKPPTIYGGSGLIGYVTNVYTEEPFRGRGIGTQLMRELNTLALNLGADKLQLFDDYLKKLDLKKWIVARNRDGLQIQMILFRFAYNNFYEQEQRPIRERGRISVTEKMNVLREQKLKRLSKK